MTVQSFQIYKKKIKKGFIYYYHVYDKEGKRLSFSTRQKTRKRAIEHCLNLFKNNALIPAQKNKHLFETYAKNWFVYDKCFYIKGKLQRGTSFSESWAKKCKSRLERHILPFFGHYEIQKIKPKDIEKWLLSLNENISNKTKNETFAILKIMMKEACRIELIDKNPADKISMLHNNKKKRGILTREEVSELFEEKNFLLYWKGNYYYYLMNILACSTGMRQGEIAALREMNVYKDHIDVKHSFEREMKKIKGTKTGEERVVPIPESLYNRIKILFRDNPRGFIFSKDEGKSPFNALRATVYFYQALEKMGISEEERKKRNITFHGWRHYFNTNLIGAGVDKMIVQSLTGHSSDAMTENYLHLGLEHLSKVIKIQEDILN